MAANAHGKKGKTLAVTAAVCLCLSVAVALILAFAIDTDGDSVPESSANEETAVAGTGTETPESTPGGTDESIVSSGETTSDDGDTGSGNKKRVSAGDIITFGAYEQDNDTSNGKESIEWLVLASEEKKILVISRYALDCQKYNSSNANTSWEKCSLRSWLNSTFMNDAFTAAQQAKILIAYVYADNNPSYSTSPGESTLDKVFLLSLNETKKYFDTDGARRCVPTAYAVAGGAYESYSFALNGKSTCLWWTRTPGDFRSYTAYIDYDGSVCYNGLFVNYSNLCIRPAMWISPDF